jgi:hypothetical protein
VSLLGFGFVDFFWEGCSGFLVVLGGLLGLGVSGQV